MDKKNLNFDKEDSYRNLDRVIGWVRIATVKHQLY